MYEVPVKESSCVSLDNTEIKIMWCL